MTTTAFLASDVTHMNFSLTVPVFFPGSFYIFHIWENKINYISQYIYTHIIGKRN